MAWIPSLGDASPKYRLVEETYPLPGNRKDLLGLIQNVLEKGRVQRLLVEIGHPLRIRRAVPDEEEVGEVVFPIGDLILAVRNHEIVELKVSSISPFESLFHAFAILAGRRFKPRALLVHSQDELREWLMLPQTFPLLEVMGVEVVVEGEVPEGTILLASVDPASQDEVSFSVRIPTSR